MARVYNLHLFPGKIGFCQKSFPCVYIQKQYINVRNLCQSACQFKNPKEEVNSETELFTENDLDFFGLNQFDKENPKPLNTNEKSEKKTVDKVIRKHLFGNDGPKKNVNIEVTRYGSVRFDNSIPLSEKPKKLTRQEKRLKKGSATFNTETLPKLLALHNEKKGDNVDNTHLAIKHSMSRPVPVDKDNTSKRENRRQPHEDDVSFSTGGRKIESDEHVTRDDSELQKKLFTSQSEMSCIDEQYFHNNDSHYESSGNTTKQDLIKYDNVSVNDTGNCHEVENVERTDSAENLCNAEQNLSFVDEQFFGDYNHDSAGKSSEFGRKSVKTTLNSHGVEKFIGTESTENLFKKRQDLSFVDEQYFKSYHNSNDMVSHENKEQQNFNQLAKHEYERKNQSEADKSMKRGDKHINKLGHVNHTKNIGNKSLSSENSQLVYAASIQVRKEFEKKRGSNLIGTYDPKEYDSAGFRILKNQVPHFHNAPSIDVVQVLRRSIIYDDNDILAISKPYGLPSYDGTAKAHSVGDFLDEIIPNNKLFPVHRLDKETTGVILLARTEEMQKRLKDRFYSREIVKKYLVITKNIPEMPNGEIDIPITEGTVEGKVRMCLRPYDSPELRAIAKKRQPGKVAITKYKVLDQGQKCALLECFPLTGKKHQIRVHLAFGLNCPILGDHKYSHMNKLAPMVLHPEILRKLHIQQSKVRYLAMHLHARSVMIPEFLDGRNLFIKAPIPPHFVRNMKDLKLKFPEHV